MVKLGFKFRISILCIATADNSYFNKGKYSCLLQISNLKLRMSLQRVIILQDMLRKRVTLIIWFLKMVPLTRIHPPGRNTCAVFRFWICFLKCLTQCPSHIPLTLLVQRSTPFISSFARITFSITFYHEGNTLVDSGSV